MFIFNDAYLLDINILNSYCDVHIHDTGSESGSVYCGKNTHKSDSVQMAVFKIDELKNSYYKELEKLIVLTKKYNNAFSKLSPLEYTVLQAFYFENKTLKETAKVVKYSWNNVHGRILPKIYNKIMECVENDASSI